MKGKRKQSLSITVIGKQKIDEKKGAGGRGKGCGEGATQGRTLTRQNRDKAPMIIHSLEYVARAAVSLRQHRE